MATKSTWHSLEKLKKGHLLHKCSLLSGRTFYLHWVQTLFPVSYWFLISQIILLSPHKIYLLRGREGRAVRGSKTSQWETEWERERREERRRQRESDHCHHWSTLSKTSSRKHARFPTCESGTQSWEPALLPPGLCTNRKMEAGASYSGTLVWDMGFSLLSCWQPQYPFPVCIWYRSSRQPTETPIQAH